MLLKVIQNHYAVYVLIWKIFGILCYSSHHAMFLMDFRKRKYSFLFVTHVFKFSGDFTQNPLTKFFGKNLFRVIV